jgi:hypothetical protein
MTSPIADAPRHLLTVWTPSYAADALQAHLEVLLGWAEAASQGKAEARDVYVWWAKLRSQNRQQPLPHRAEVLALEAQIEAGIETNLYLTDYRSLYVAQLDEITADDVLAEWPDEIDHMPHYYAGQHADFWFRLLDLRLLVADDTVATIEELKRLRNVRYHDRPVSLYGGMVELPLIVWRDTAVSWFGDRAEMTGGALWAEHDAAVRGGVERMSRELRDNLLGRALWARLEPATRTFLAAAEATYRARRDDPRFDFSGALVSYAKAVETELNAVVFRALRAALARSAPHERVVWTRGERIDLDAPLRHQGLGALQHLLTDGQTGGLLRRAMQPHGAWLTGVLPVELEALAEARNRAAHSEAVREAEVTELREKILGIGQEGWITRLGRLG